jgi:hypothetical protein
MKKLMFALLVCGLLGSCEQEPLLPGKFISDQLGQLHLGDDNGIEYQYQLYFDLSTGKLMAKNSRDVWDIGFSCGSEPNLLINPAMFQAVASTGETDFNKTYVASGYHFQYQRPDTYYRKGFLQTDFNGQGVPQGEVFLLDLGRDLQNQKRGIRKLQLLDYTNGKYTLRVAELNGGNEQLLEVQTNSTYNYQYLSLNSPDTVLSLEPPKELWDLHFTKYMERLWDGEDTVDYSVTGCLINPFNCAAYDAGAEDSVLTYGNVEAADVRGAAFETRSNAIGHEWKYYDLDAGAYQIRGGNLFLVKDTEQQVYKFHFIGFYDAQGRKGAVSFEYLPL